jgi:enoyl-CoA hydratase
VSAVNGLVQGGGLLIAMLSDVAVLSDRVRLRVPELLVGVTDTFYAHILPAHVGVARARDLMFTAREFSAEEAVEWGLVARVVPHAELEAAVTTVVAEIGRTAPAARRQVKRIMHDRYGNVDKFTFEDSMTSAEFDEGKRAFSERRDPSWIRPEFSARRPAT